MVLKGCVYVGAFLCRLCMSNSFGARAGFCMDAIHVFPQSVLVIIPLIGGVVGVVLSRAYAECEAELPLCSVAITALLGRGLLPSCWSRSREVQV